MKKIVSAAGLAALGALGLQAAAGDGLSRIEASKPWSIKANLRGFYDDNVFTTPGDATDRVYYTDDQGQEQFTDVPVDEVSSFGIEVRPSASLRLVTDQTLLSLNYEYGHRWFNDRPGRKVDASHVAGIALTHDFDANTSLSLNETFIFAQEPEIAGDPGTTRRFRGNLNSIHNEASIALSRRITETISGNLSYRNDLFEYKDKDRVGSFSSLLDRNENKISATLAAQISDPTTVFVGYQFKQVDFTSSDLIVKQSPATINGADVKVDIASDRRNSRTHYLFGGVDHMFNPDLTFGARLGAQFVSYYNIDGDAKQIDAAPDDSVTSPYADINLNYRYAEGSNLTLGIRNERNQTDLALISGRGLVLDQETLSIYGSIQHQVTSKISVGAVGLFAQSDFGDSVSSQGDDEFYSLGLNASYTINQYLSADAGYNFDDLDSDAIQRGFDRNRYYVGLKANF